MEENYISPENQQPTRPKKPIHIWILIGILGFTAITVIPYNIYSYIDYKKKEEAEKIYELCMEIDSKDKILLNNFAILLF